MRYWGPINSPGGIYGNDGYVDGNPGAGIQGSIPTFRTFEQQMRELQNLVVSSGLTPDQVMNGIQVSQAVQSHRMNYSADGGTADALTATLDPVPASLSHGLLVTVKKGAAANATTTPTLNVNSLGARIITYPDGTAMRVGDLVPNSILSLLYDAVTSKWVLISLNMRTIIISIAMSGLTTVIYTSGSGTFVPLQDVYALRDVEIVGGGGGGGGSDAATNKAGGGGNGGQVVRGDMPCTPGVGINWSVGTGGAAGTSASDAGDGGNTTFGSWIATPGKGGKTNGNPGAAAATPTGGTHYYVGGQGDGALQLPADNHFLGGDGGGNAAGGAGGNGAKAIGAIATLGNPGIAPGGAGGGGAYGSDGGIGAGGRIMFHY